MLHYINQLVVIQPITTVNVQTTVTALLAAMQLRDFGLLYFYFINDDTANTWDATIQTGEASDAIDGEYAPTLTVPVSVGGVAGQRSLIIGPDQIRGFYRVSGIALNAQVSARWGLLGRHRLVKQLVG